MDEAVKQRLMAVLRAKALEKYKVKPTPEMEGLFELMAETVQFLVQNSQVQSVVTTPQGPGEGKGKILWL